MLFIVHQTWAECVWRAAVNGQQRVGILHAQCYGLTAVVNGEQSQLLGQIHIALLRLLQMDLEEAHATGAIQASPVNTPQTSLSIILRPACCSLRHHMTTGIHAYYQCQMSWITTCIVPITAGALRPPFALRIILICLGIAAGPTWHNHLWWDQL